MVDEFPMFDEILPFQNRPRLVRIAPLNWWTLLFHHDDGSGTQGGRKKTMIAFISGHLEHIWRDKDSGL